MAFDEAQTVFSDERALIVDDPEQVGDETRLVLLGMSVPLRVLVVVHVAQATPDTIRIISTRKAGNLRSNPRLALVIGGLTPGDERTVQYEGIADEPSGLDLDLDRVTQAYYATYPDGPSRLSWTGLIYVRVRPTWIRYSGYTLDPPQIVEFTAQQLGL